MPMPAPGGFTNSVKAKKTSNMTAVAMPNTFVQSNMPSMSARSLHADSSFSFGAPAAGTVSPFNKINVEGGEDAPDPVSATGRSKPQRSVGIRPGQWMVVTVVVEPLAGRVVTFVNGEQCHVASGLDSSALRLQNKVVVLGGGKKSDTRGGDVRRLFFLDTGATRVLAPITFLCVDYLSFSIRRYRREENLLRVLKSKSLHHLDGNFDSSSGERTHHTTSITNGGTFIRCA